MISQMMSRRVLIPTLFLVGGITPWASGQESSAQVPVQYSELARLSEFSSGDLLVLPNDLLFTAEGDLLVVDEGEAKVLTLTDAMVVSGTFGSKGEGPKEFSRPGPIGRSLDSGIQYAIWDRINARLTLLETSTKFRSSRAYPLDFRHHGFVQALLYLGDGQFLVAATTWPMAGYNEESRTRVLRIGSDGVEEELSVHPGYDLLINMEDLLFVSVVRQPFGAAPKVHFERDGSHYWVGSTTDDLLERRSVSDGSVVAAFTLGLSGRLVTAADRRLFNQAQDAQLAAAEKRVTDEQTKAIRERFEWIKDHVSFPERMPIWEDFALDENDDIWIRLVGHLADGPKTWLHLSQSGRVLHEVFVPHRGEIYATDVDQGRIVVTEQNELDIWELVEYGLGD